MKCGLLGRKLSHSYSPQIHSYLGDYPYTLFEREPEDMDSEEYDAWAQEHEALEDDIDDVLDALERFQG